jgi:hypothetical protein
MLAVTYLLGGIDVNPETVIVLSSASGAPSGDPSVKY